MRCAISYESNIMRPLLRESMDSICLPFPALINARSQFGDEKFESGFSVRVDSSAKRRSSLHSVSVRRLSTIAAKLSLKSGMGGSVFSKSSFRRIAFEAGPRRKSSGT